MHIKLIVNSRAGRKGGISTNGATIDDVRAALAACGIAPDIEETREPGHATELARAAALAGYDGVIAAGGDGTTREAAIGLLGSGVPLGVMPLGSFMNVARMLGIPRDLPGAAAVIAGGEAAAIDVGRAGKTYFLEAAGVGIDAALFRYTNQLDQGRWAALAHAARVALRYRPQRVVVQLDWWTVEMDALMVTVANGPYCGASFTVAPDAVADDHQLDVCIYGPMSKWDVLRQLLHAAPTTAAPGAAARRADPTTLVGEAEPASEGRVYAFKARDVRVSAPRPLPGHADSLPIGVTPLRFSLMPGALSVFVPTESRARHAALSQPSAHHYVEASAL